MKKILFLGLTAAILGACGGPASYSTPLVMQNRIVAQSTCEGSDAIDPFDDADALFGADDALPTPSVSVEVQNDTVVLRHENLYLPRGTLLGIEDRDGRLTWRDARPYYYLTADTDFIAVRESARLVAADEFCLYSLTVTIQNISGGEYTFYLFDHTGAAVPEATSLLKIR